MHVQCKGQAHACKLYVVTHAAFHYVLRQGVGLDDGPPPVARQPCVCSQGDAHAEGLPDELQECNLHSSCTSSPATGIMPICA
jgi:hypothetical protein